MDALHRALQRLDNQVTDLELEFACQSAELSLLAEKLSQLRTEANVERASDLSGLDSQERTDGETLEPRQSEQTRTVRRHSTDLPAIVPPPYLGENWDTYIRDVDQYITDHGIEVTHDPLGQLLPHDRAAEVQREFVTDFGAAPWDRWDYGAIALAVIVGALIDYFLVATPGGTFKGEPQRGSPLQHG
ncbi:MAG: hypothetical protein F4069_09160 [Rhodothermaceae bacterium]|nr:hypothetical protein [Rhodothermaceae bacterium]MYG70540.1 hypothetical protein [Rhodothermaceae bacterium]MYJ45475.1 hypothetical protein [Rhodothermaceae bacterium]